MRTPIALMPCLSACVRASASMKTLVTPWRESGRGAIVDGGIRDTHQIAVEEFPIFYRFHSSSRMLGRARVVGHRIPVLIGDTMVFPGDIVVADIDGALVVPRRIACDVLLRTEQVIGFETDIEGWVDAGDSPSEIVAKGGYF